ncbi:hypothetical protein CHELA40_12065 [Chelatococcus asaccharovorans]|nr:hypothetical protein CHELA40_12065 [Chelatococcus asaccharovorans]CAH1683517.1 hypothetical protein CHELA17_63539 [Chelatococcus asaccharovorans]
MVDHGVAAAKRGIETVRLFWSARSPQVFISARFDLIASDRRSNVFYFKHNLIDPRFTPVGLCSSGSAPTFASA